MKINNSKGFTLIELLIVVAIIAILAAIAIPQFSAYRIRGFNASANSDVRNLATTQEALFADTQAYGQTQTAGVLTTTACSATGVLLLGPMNPASSTVGTTGSYISNILGSVGFSISNNVSLATKGTVPGTGNACDSYVLAAKHAAGDACFGRDSNSTASYRAASTVGALVLGDVPTASNPAIDMTDFGKCLAWTAQ
jgi:prepilin-type N-terminal cleavage/methylation domain-containing protein